MTHSVIMPDLGQTTAEGRIVRWLKTPGDKVVKGDALLEVETDKVTMEVEAYREGYLRTVLVEAGQAASAMSTIALLTDDPEEECKGPAIGAQPAAKPGKDAGAARTTHADAAGAMSSPHERSLDRPAATPAAKAAALSSRQNLAGISGTGPRGLITRRDVEKARTTHASSRPAALMAAITARSAAEIPHFFATVDVDVSNLIQWREGWNAAHPALHASFNDVFVRAASLALRDAPWMNTRYRDGRVEELDSTDVLLVTATESGLVFVPIEDPAAIGWEAHLSRMRRSLEVARQKRIMSSLPHPPALAVSNLGMFGVKQFSAIVPPECSAILAVGAVREVVRVKNRQISIGDACSLTLSCDHRVIDGIMAARFLERVQTRLNSL